MPIRLNAQLTGAQIFSPENLVVLIGYVFGLALIFANPPFQSNDEDRHFFNSYYLSTGQLGPTQLDNRVGGYLPYNLLYVTDVFQGIPYYRGAKIVQVTFRELTSVPLNETRKIFYDNPTYEINPVPYLPFAAGILITKLINSNPVHLLWGARIVGLLAFLSIMYFAIKVIPCHKYVLLALALSPTTLFQAASVTYDSMSFAFSFLLAALALKFAFQDRPLRTRDIALYCVIAILQTCSKPGYFLIPFIFCLIPQKNIGTPRRYIVAVAAIGIACLLPTVVWGGYLRALHLAKGKPLCNDFLYGSVNQWIRFLHAPAVAAGEFLLNFVVQGREWIIGALGKFGYSYISLNHGVIFGQGLALIALSVVDASRTVAISVRQKLIAAAVSFGTIVMIAAFFFYGSPVGAHRIFGLQGRYFIPVESLALLPNAHPSFWTKAGDRWKSIIVPVWATALLAYTVFFIYSRFY